MSLQAIVEKIKANAQIEVQAIIAETQTKTAEIEKETKDQVNRLNEEFANSLQKRKEQKESVLTSLEKQKLSLKRQTVKRQLVDEVYQEAFSEILALSSADYVAMLLKKYKELVPAEVKVSLILAPENRLAEITEVAKGMNWNADIKADSSIIGGCKLVSDNFEFDLSLEKLFSQDRNKTETKVAKVLFI